MEVHKTPHSEPEFLICFLTSLLTGVRSVAVGASSPIPAAAALLASVKSRGNTTAMILGSDRHSPFNDGGPELFDRAGQGRIDAFIMGGGQIDGGGNINLVGTGEYPRSKTRFPGSFGTPYLYSLVPKVILFRNEHSRRILVPEVDFVTATGVGPKGVYRPGGPCALVTNRAYFRFDREAAKFLLVSTHPGNDLREIEENTAFEFDVAESISKTLPPTPRDLDLLRNRVFKQLSNIYPHFTSHLLSGGTCVG